MTGLALIAAAIPASATLIAAVFYAGPKLVEQWRLRVRERHLLARIDELWAMGERDAALRLEAWLQNTDHPPPELPAMLPAPSRSGRLAAARTLPPAR